MGFPKQWCIHIIPAVLASLAFMTSSYSSFCCASIKFEPETADSTTTDNPLLNTRRFGPWSYETSKVRKVSVVGQERLFISQECKAYPSSMGADSELKTTRAFSVMVLLLGGLMTLALWFAPCSYLFSASAWKSLAIFSGVVLTLFQGLTFLLLKSELLCGANNSLLAEGVYSDECDWEAGSTANVISVVLWFLTGAAMVTVGVPTRPPRAPTETQTVTYQRTVNPDGTAVVSEVKVVKGVAVAPKETATELNTMEEAKEEE